MTTIYGHYGRPCTSCGREINCNCYPVDEQDKEDMRILIQRLSVERKLAVCGLKGGHMGHNEKLVVGMWKRLVQARHGILFTQDERSWLVSLRKVARRADQGSRNALLEVAFGLEGVKREVRDCEDRAEDDRYWEVKRFTLP